MKLVLRLELIQRSKTLAFYISSCLIASAAAVDNSQKIVPIKTPQPAVVSPSSSAGAAKSAGPKPTSLVSVASIAPAQTASNGYGFPANNGYVQPKSPLASASPSKAAANTASVVPKSTSSASVVTQGASSGYSYPANNSYMQSTNGYSQPAYSQPAINSTTTSLAKTSGATLPPASPAQPAVNQKIPISTKSSLASPIPINKNVAGSTPAQTSGANWLDPNKIGKGLFHILTDVSERKNVALKLETYTTKQFGGIRVGEYRLSPSASIDVKGVAGGIKVLEAAGKAAMLYDIYHNTKTEFESRGITGSTLVNAWVSAPESIVFAFNNPDAGIKALTQGFTSASAVSIRFASFGLVEITGPEVEKFVYKIADTRR